MKKYCFKNDYSEGCHPNILEALTHANLEQEEGYCEDNYCREAGALIKNKINNPDASIHFAASGTLANLIVAASALRPYESIISAGTGHINVHETGSIEATGHKINLVNSNDGKLRPVDIQNILEEHATVPHMVKPRMVYISNATEVGTVYNRSELELLSSYCSGKDLFLFIDGARLANALCAADNNLNLSDFAKLTDIFTIG